MPGSTAVYVDILFLINFVMDFMVLWAAAKIAQIRVSIWRLFAGAAIGACYSILVLLPGFYVLTGIETKFFVSILMVLAAYCPLPLKKLGQVVFYFYVVAFTMGGAVLGLVYLVGGSSITGVMSNLPLNYLWLAIALVVAVIFGKYGVAYLKKSLLQDLIRVPVEICVLGKRFKLMGLVDTGNQLVDPLTGFPVIIVEYGILEPYLPRDFQNIVNTAGEVDLSKLVNVGKAKGDTLSFRLIPFTTIGKKHGMLVGFRPDEVVVLAGDQRICKTDVVVGIFNRSLSPRRSYQALLHPDLVEAVMDQ